MKINFKINYYARPDERMFVLGTIPELGGGEAQNAVEMNYEDDGNWSLQVKTNATSVRYHYLLKANGATTREELTKCHSAQLPAKREVTLHDSWETAEAERVFRSKAFLQKIGGRMPEKSHLPQYSQPMLFRVKAFRVPKTAGVMLLGNRTQLGNWNSRVAPKLTIGPDGYWQTVVDAEKLQFPLEYKYAVYDQKTDEILFWESGDNHRMEWQDLRENALYVRTDEAFRTGAMPLWKAAGVSVPVFSLRTADDFGVGEFPDLKKMIDWAAMTSQKIIQILPVNDTTLSKENTDSYPYNAISVFALHPMYANIEKIGKLKNIKIAAAYAKEKDALNKKTFVDYAEVNRLKWKYFRYLYEINMPSLQKTADYQAFFKKNESWLAPYAVFSYLRDQNGTPDFRRWKTLSAYDAAAVVRMARQGSAEYDGIAIYFFVQYHLHKQLTEVKEYAQQKNIVLKGDIPIGVSPCSVEAWMDAESFNTSMSAGAPPDDFSAIGQNWGFPTYNWDVMAENGYKWWRERFTKMNDYFDAFRIDHILGFFRIWEIPTDAVWGLLGHFNPAKPMSVSEIEASGAKFDEKRFLRPYITDELLQQLFGDEKTKIVRDFLRKDGNLYAFQNAVDTQKKTLGFCLENEFYAGRKDLQEKLLGLHCEVLFLRDARRPDLFHPRISMPKSYTFGALADDAKNSLGEIYTDFFYRRHNEFWKNQAMKKLPALLDVTDMMVCGEDLGMIPQTVPDVMNRLQILSLEIERMPKSPDAEFADLRRIPYLSVCTPATHDMSPLRLWWEEDAPKSQRYFNQVLQFVGNAPREATPFVCEHIIRDHLWSSAMWTIFQLQDWISMSTTLRAGNYAAERINEPSNPRHFWSYRIHFDLEKLLESVSFNAKIRDLITFSGRNLDF